MCHILKNVRTVIMVSEARIQMYLAINGKEVKTMKKLEKRFNQKRNTVEAYRHACSCTCYCHYCAAYYESQYDADSLRISRNSRDSI